MLIFPIPGLRIALSKKKSNTESPRRYNKSFATGRAAAEWTYHTTQTLTALLFLPWIEVAKFRMETEKRRNAFFDCLQSEAFSAETA